MAYKFKDYTKSDDVKKAEAKAAEYDTYTESNAVTDYRNKMTDYETNNKVADWTGGTYGDAVKDAWNNINNRAKFSYDLNGDALYQQYKDKFINQGRLAMADTIGQASAMTGGYGSSYAVTAGNQAYQSHLQNLNDIVPQLYQMAYDRYTQEGQDLKDKYSILNNMYQTEYGEHRDKKSDYYTELGRLTEAYNTERAYDRGVYETDRTHYTTVADNLYNRDFNAHNVAEQNAFNTYQQDVTETYQNESLKLQREAATKAAEKWGGLTFEQIETLNELHSGQKWEEIDRYLGSLNLEDADLAAMQKLWLSKDYLNSLYKLTTGKTQKIQAGKSGLYYTTEIN